MLTAAVPRKSSRRCRRNLTLNHLKQWIRRAIKCLRFQLDANAAHDEDYSLRL